MWYGQCEKNRATNLPLNCFYNGKAKLIENRESRDILAKLCPEFSHKDSKVCCDIKQILSLQSGIQSAQQMMTRCPACWKNFRELYCQMTCSPNNSLFIDPILTLSKKSVQSIEYNVDQTFRDGLYNSCKNVIFPSSNQKIMNFLCGTKAENCNPLKFLRFMGDPTLNGDSSPFLIEYPPSPKANSSIVPMYVDVKLCDKTVYIPYTNSTAAACSCQDCIESCPPVPHYTPTTHWELDVGDIHFNIISFATLLVYLAFLVVFTAGSIVYFKYSSNRKTFSEHSKAVVGGRQRSPGLVAYLGKSMDQKIKLVFSKWGNICSDYSIIVIIGAVVFVIICSIGLVKFTVITDPVKLWSAPGSQARREKDIFDSKFSPFFRTAQIIFSVKPDSNWSKETCYTNFGHPKECSLTGKILRLEALQKVSYLKG